MWGSPGLRPSLDVPLCPSPPIRPGRMGFETQLHVARRDGWPRFPIVFGERDLGSDLGFPSRSTSSSLSSALVPHRTSCLDGHRQLCPELLPSAQRGPRCAPCPQPHQGQAGCPPAWWHLGPSAPWSRSASSPAPSSFAPTKRAGTRSAFLSRNDGFLAKSCSSVAVTTLPQFPSKDVFLCCDRDAGRAPGRRLRACGCTTGARGSCHQRPGPGTTPGDTGTAPALGQPHGRAPRSTTAP